MDGNSFIHSRKNVDNFWLNFLYLSGAEVRKSCRSRQELSMLRSLVQIFIFRSLSMSLFLNILFETDSYSNEYVLAKIGVDTAENEPLKVHLIFKLWDSIFTEPPRPSVCLPQDSAMMTLRTHPTTTTMSDRYRYPCIHTFYFFSHPSYSTRLDTHGNID